MYDASWRFDVDDGRHPNFSDSEIAEALDGIGTNALPFLRSWLLPNHRGVLPWLNAQLSRTGWVRFRFKVDNQDYSSEAETGFMYYAEDTRALLPWLLQLTRNPDAHVRMAAYEAAFFARPGSEVFLPLADKALQDRSAGCMEMAAQWMAERFPHEALKRHLQLHYPQFYSDSTNADHVPP